MKNLLLSAACLALVVSTGCGKSDSPKGALAPVAAAFPEAAANSADPVQAAVHAAVTAAAANDAETAALTLMTVRAAPNLSAEQRTAVQDAMGQLQSSLAARAESGDAAAQQAMNAIRAGNARR